MLSGTASYALRAVVYLASLPDHQPVRASELARAVDVPRNYLGKILHELVRAGILKSTRGKGGGFELAVLPEITRRAGKWIRERAAAKESSSPTTRASGDKPHVCSASHPIDPLIPTQSANLK